MNLAIIAFTYSSCIIQKKYGYRRQRIGNFLLFSGSSKKKGKTETNFNGSKEMATSQPWEEDTSNIIKSEASDDSRRDQNVPFKMSGRWRVSRSSVAKSKITPGFVQGRNTGM